LELEHGGTSVAFSISTAGCGMHCRLWILHFDAPKSGRSKLYHSDTQQALDPTDSGFDECGTTVLCGESVTRFTDAEYAKYCTFRYWYGF